ncbi:MAG: hypothetical protein E7231_01260 [Cellulosilyticum sp.]|nr:hypothetical protein [Cellulosilyticum sp.]
MIISEIRQSNNPYIKLNKNASELDVPIHLINHKVIERYENCNCFDTNSINVDGVEKQVNFFSENVTYDLCCEDNNFRYIWRNVSFKQLKDTDALCVFADSKADIYSKTANENEKVLYFININIKFWKLITSIAAIFIAIIVLSQLPLKNIVSDVRSSIPQIENPFAGVFNWENKQNEQISGDETTEIDNSLPDEMVEEPVKEEIVEEQENVIEKKQDFSYTSDNYKGKGVTYVLLEKEKYTPRLVVTDEAKTIAEITDEANGIIGINASAWNEEEALNFTYADGNWISDNKRAYEGDPLSFANGELSVIDHKYATKKMLEKSDPEWIATGYKAVIFNTYSTNEDDEESYNRSFIGQLKNGNYIVGVMENASYSDMVEWARGIYGYDISILYNTDKGDTCGLYINNEEIYTGTLVKNAIVF